MKKSLILVCAALSSLAVAACEDRDDLASNPQEQVAGDGAATPQEPYTPPPSPPETGVAPEATAPADPAAPPAAPAPTY